jgi:hypothetical protein
MKLAIAALGLAIVTATGAAAMVGPYERAAHDNPSAIATSGNEGYVRTGGLSASPEADWNNGEVRHVTIFSTQGADDGATRLGADQR